VWVGQSTDHGLKDIYIRTEAPAAIWFDAAIDRLADSLGALGDADDKEVRRAKAVGILAHPQQALDLLDDTVAASATSDGPATDEPAAADDVRTLDRRSAPSKPKATLHVHIAADSLGDGDNRVARVEEIGAATIEQVRKWLASCDVTVKPVLDLAAMAPVDCYEIPDQMREAVHLIVPADAFPFASSTSRRTDIDHTIPYRQLNASGPRGQTRIGNLEKLTRFHHRVKTHGRWQVKQPFPGVFLWRSPHGRMFLVDQTGTRRLRQPA
jgi:hypothetical protein